MENKKVKIEVEVDVKGGENVKDLKASLRELTDAAAGVDENSEAFQRLSTAAGEVKNKLDDINQSINSQSGKPIDNVRNSFSLLGDKLKSLDFKGATSAIQGLGNNLKSLNLKDITSGIGEMGSALLALGKSLLVNPIFLLAATLTAVALATKAWIDNEQEKAIRVTEDLSKAIRQEIDDINDLDKELDRSSKNAIALLQAKGVDEIEIQEAKLKALKKAETQYSEDILALQARTTELTNNFLASTDLKQRDIIKADLKLAQDTLAEKHRLQEQAIADIEIQGATIKTLEQTNAEKIQADADKAAATRKDKRLKDLEDQEKEAQKLLEKAIDDAFKLYDKDTKNFLAEQEKKNERVKTLNEQRLELAFSLTDALAKTDKEKAEAQYQRDLEALNKKYDSELHKSKEFLALKEQLDKDYAQKQIDIDKEVAQKKKDLQEKSNKSVFNASRALSDAIFAIQLAGVQKGSAAELAVKKHQFAVNKAFNVSSVIIDTARGIVKTIAELGGVGALTPPGIALIASMGVIGAANVAKILATKFDGGGGSGGGDTGTPTVLNGGQGGGSISTGNGGGGFQPAGLQQVGGNVPITPPVAPLNDTQRQQPQKIYVVTTDISSSQNKNAVLERRAEF